MVSAPTLTIYTDEAPCPRVEVFFNDLDPATATLTAYRTANGREYQVRGMVGAAVSGAISRIDYEAPFNTPVMYRAEMFDSSGLSLGFTPAATLGSFTPWVETRRNLDTNPQAVGSGDTSPFGARFSWTRSFITSGSSSSDLPFATVARFTSPESGSLSSRGVDSYGNAGAATPGTTGDWIAGPVVNPGTTLTISRYVRISIPITTGLVIRARFHDGAGNWVGTLQTGTSTGTVASGWRRPSWTGVVPAGATRVSIQVGTVGAETFAVGTFLDIAGLLTEVSATLRLYMDGSFSSTANLAYSWAGTVNASASILQERTTLSVGIQSSDTWLLNPLDPQGAVKVELVDTTGRALSRPVPGVVSRPLGRQVGVVLSQPRYGLVGFQFDVRVHTLEDADKVQALIGGYGDSTVPVICIRLGGDETRLSIPQPLFLGVLDIVEQDINTVWGGEDTRQLMEGDEAAPPTPALFIPLLHRMDIDAYYVTRNALNADNASRTSIDRRYDLAGYA